MTHFNLLTFSFLVFFSFNSINKSIAKGVVPDSLIYYDDINEDGKNDMVTKLDRNLTFRIHLSNGKNTFKKHEINLKYCLADVSPSIDISSFGLLKMKSNLKFRLKIMPDFVTVRTLNVTYIERLDDFEVFSYYDTTKDALDPDSLEAGKYNLLTSSQSIKRLNFPLTENIYSSNSIITFSPKRKIIALREEMRGGNIRKHPKERLEFFLHSQPLNVKNLVAYNDVGYYLEQNEYYEEAVFILEIITKKFPDRTVAYLNLGDAFWGLNKTDLAMKSYNMYSDLMRKSGKETLISKKIIEREKEVNKEALNHTQSVIMNDTVSATMPDREKYEGLYTLMSCEGVKHQLEIRRNEEFQLKYKLLGNGKIISYGRAMINGDYVVIDNFVGEYKEDSIVLHNLGNEINGFHNFIQCDEKYVTFTK